MIKNKTPYLQHYRLLLFDKSSLAMTEEQTSQTRFYIMDCIATHPTSHKCLAFAPRKIVPTSCNVPITKHKKSILPRHH
ncbi:hypothetical protein [Helicobacter rodentium]|uniref:hypothetical protein n=1 Tax=Helicobacter rodentium TaxID=59617 RepID=UPI0012EC2E7D|nr:hypothetical protein [Helicobacter rodentium]